MQTLRWVVVVMVVLGLGGSPTQSLADSQAGIIASGAIQSLASAAFLTIGGINIAECISSLGTAPGLLLLGNACAESGISFLLGAMSAVGAAQTLSAGDEQEAESYTGEGFKAGMSSTGGATGAEGECSDLQKQTCDRLRKIGKIKRLGKCGCTLAKMPVDPKTGEIKNETLARVTPPEIQKAMMDAVRTGDYSNLNKAADGKLSEMKQMSPEELNKKIGEAEDKLEAEGGSLSRALAGTKLGEDGVELDELEAAGGGAAAKAEDWVERDKFLTGGSATVKLAKAKTGGGGDDDGLSEAERRRLRKKWKKLAKNKKHGIIPHDRIGIFFVIKSRYDAMEKGEYQVKYYNIKRGKYISVKRIGDQSAPPSKKPDKKTKSKDLKL